MKGNIYECRPSRSTPELLSESVVQSCRGAVKPVIIQLTLPPQAGQHRCSASLECKLPLKAVGEDFIILGIITTTAVQRQGQVIHPQQRSSGSGHCSLEVARAPVGSMLPSANPDVWPEAGLPTAPSVTRSA
ncbi:unnamed protein product [Boreogadus saida]